MTPHDGPVLNSPGFYHPHLPEWEARPWFLGDAPAPATEPREDRVQREMRAELFGHPLIRVLAGLLEFIGDGRRVTKQGRLFAADRKEFAGQFGLARSWGYGAEGHGVETAWTLLLTNGWLALADGQVRPAEEPPYPGGFDAGAEHYLEACRLAFASVLETDDVGPYGWGARYADEEILEALLIASSPAGLTLPDHPVDGAIVHCQDMVRFLVGLVQHPWIRDVPIERSTGHIEHAALRGLAGCGQALRTLRRRGVVVVEVEADPYELEYEEYLDPCERPDRTTTFRAPVVMRGAVELVRERRRAREHSSGMPVGGRM